MSIFKKNSRQVAIVPAVYSDDSLNESVFASDYSDFFEFDVQKTADTENDFPTIAQGYPISGFKDVINHGKFE